MFRQLRHITTAALIVCAVPLLAQTVDTDSKVKMEVLNQVSNLMSERAFVPGIDFSKWPQFIDDEKPEIESAKTDEEFQRAVNAALHKFGASHVFLMTPRGAQTRRTGSTVGIGITTQVVPEGLSILNVVKDGPADKAGLVRGDTITELDGKPISAQKGLTGPEGSDVSIKVKHSDGKVEPYKLTRKSYSTVRTPEISWPDKDTALIKIYSFDTGYSRMVVNDLMTEAQTAKNLIIDLRYNGGGAVSNLQHLLGYVIPTTKPLGTFLTKSSVDDFIAKNGEKPADWSPSDLASVAQDTLRKFRATHREEAPFFTGKVAVLVNRFSGSASEIAAAALHDVLGSPVIGTKSAGAVLASIIVPATNGFMLQFPIEDYVTIKGVRLEGNGVIPDIDAADPVFKAKETKDEGIEKALAYFAQPRQQVITK